MSESRVVESSISDRRAHLSRAGKAVPPEKRAFSRDRDLAVRAGRKGSDARRENMMRKAAEEARALFGDRAFLLLKI